MQTLNHLTVAEDSDQGLKIGPVTQRPYDTTAL
ncbi:hypothetical protein ACOMHN_032892 [Nucella lapillus]